MRTTFPKENGDSETAPKDSPNILEGLGGESEQDVKFPKRLRYRGKGKVRWGETPDAVGRHVMEDAAIEGYRAGRLSHRQVGEMPGLDYWQTEAFLKDRGVPVNYSAADLHSDMILITRQGVGSYN